MILTCFMTVGRDKFTIGGVAIRLWCVPKAVSNLKMAVTFERSNGSLKEKLESLQAAVKANPSKNPYLR